MPINEIESEPDTRRSSEIKKCTIIGCKINNCSVIDCKLNDCEIINSSIK